LRDRLVFVCALLFILLCAGCAKRRLVEPAAAPPPAPKQNLVVLLPDETGKVGSIVVKNAAGTQELTQGYQAVRVERSDVAPTAPFAMDPVEVKRVFGSAIDAMPLPERRFLLYSELGRDELTPESLNLIPEVLKAIQELRSTDISVTGHTDTTGDSRSNYQLGLRRAQGVAALLESKGVDRAILSITSHSEADLLVKTADEVAEPRNRRVEVIVR
jgi:outer membrane protein OmpA-like peptidoglycan-associated protein